MGPDQRADSCRGQGFTRRTLPQGAEYWKNLYRVGLANGRRAGPAHYTKNRTKFKKFNDF